MAYFDARGVRVPVAVECLQVVPGRVASASVLHQETGCCAMTTRPFRAPSSSSQWLLTQPLASTSCSFAAARRRRSLRLRQESWGSAFAMRSPSSAQQALRELFAQAMSEPATEGRQPAPGIPGNTRNRWGILARQKGRPKRNKGIGPQGPQSPIQVAGRILWTLGSKSFAGVHWPQRLGAPVNAAT